MACDQPIEVGSRKIPYSLIFKNQKTGQEMLRWDSGIAGNHKFKCARQKKCTHMFLLLVLIQFADKETAFTFSSKKKRMLMKFSLMESDGLAHI